MEEALIEEQLEQTEHQKEQEDYDLKRLEWEDVQNYLAQERAAKRASLATSQAQKAIELEQHQQKLALMNEEFMLKKQGIVCIYKVCCVEETRYSMYI